MSMIDILLILMTLTGTFMSIHPIYIDQKMHIHHLDPLGEHSRVISTLAIHKLCYGIIRSGSRSFWPRLYRHLEQCGMENIASATVYHQGDQVMVWQRQHVEDMRTILDAKKWHWAMMDDPVSAMMRYVRRYTAWTYVMIESEHHRTLVSLEDSQYLAQTYAMSRYTASAAAMDFQRRVGRDLGEYTLIKSASAESSTLPLIRTVLGGLLHHPQLPQKPRILEATKVTHVA